MSESSRDVPPRESRVATSSHPGALARAARLAGLEPADPRRCRVLELGCAEGRNLLPMAFHLEESRFVGVDASAAGLELGREAAARLGLDNLELIHANPPALGEDLGPFDYVLAPGLLCWVDEEAQDELLEAIRRHLAPGGVAYLGYESVAGGGTFREMREIARTETEGLESPEEQVARVRELLGVLAASPLAESSHHAAALASGAREALTAPDALLYHRLLAPGHRPLRHADLLALVERHGLARLGELPAPGDDAGLSSSLREAVAERLGGGAALEDLLDLMLGRGSRAALLCLRDAAPAELDPALPSRVARRSLFRAAIQPEQRRASLEPEVAEAFVTARGARVSARHPRLKAALLELGQAWPGALSLAEVEERTSMLLELRRVLPPGRTMDEEEREALASDLAELHRLGHVEMHLWAPAVATAPGPTPRVSALTRLEAARGQVVTSPYHELVLLDAFARELVAHLDGARELEELEERMAARLAEGAIVIRGEDGEALSPEEREEALPEILEEALSHLAFHGLLTAS